MIRLLVLIQSVIGNGIDMTETYNKRIVCINCFNYELHTILKGIKVDKYSKKVKCNKCGCNII